MARRTFSDYKGIVRHAIGNTSEASMGTGLKPDDIVNDAIEHIASMHEWNWLSTGEKQLDVTEGQDFVELPADYGTLIAIEHDQAWARQMIPTTWIEMLHYRRNPLEGFAAGFFYVINTGNVETGNEDAGLSLPTLNLYPTPAESRVGAIRLVYRRFLRRLESDDDRPQWPAYMDRALTLLSRAFVSTDYDDDPESAYTGEFRNLITDLMEKDGLSVQSFGVSRGATTPRRMLVPWGYPVDGVPNPTEI